jgi:hypothetical protein
MRKKPTRIVASAEYDLPLSFHKEIGRIMVRWAYFEQTIRRLAWDALGVDDRLGRISVRDPRIDSRIEMIGEIAFLRNIKIDPQILGTLQTRAAEILRWRDLLAHGVWIPKGKIWLVQMVSGTYPKNYEAEHRKRRVNPEGVNVDIDGLRTISRGIKILIELALELREQLEPQLRPSPETHRKR